MRVILVLWVQTISVMQTYLGHSTITITKDIYTHLMHGTAEQLMGKLDDLLAV